MQIGIVAMRGAKVVMSAELTGSRLPRDVAERLSEVSRPARRAVCQRTGVAPGPKRLMANPTRVTPRLSGVTPAAERPMAIVRLPSRGGKAGSQRALRGRFRGSEASLPPPQHQIRRTRLGQRHAADPAA